MRISWKEISWLRLMKAIKRRFLGVPDRLSFVYSKRGRANAHALESLKDIHKGETAILLANGPSLANEDLRCTKNYQTFGLNRVYLGFDKLGIELDYLVCVNNLVLSQFGDELGLVQCKKFLAWSARAHLASVKDTYWLNPGLQVKSFSTNIARGINPAATVTFAALQIIYHMGFEKVLILGMDHSFNLKKSNIPNTTETYDHEKDVNHFLPNYFPKGVKWETPDLVSSEYFYLEAREAFERAGRRIVDCTTDGKCQVFEKGILTEELRPID